MPQLQIIDLFPAFQAFWTTTRHKPLVAQLDDWAADYMAPWPELLRKQLEDYASQGEDWRLIAGEHIFPYLGQRLPAMAVIHDRLPGICAALYRRAEEILHLDSDLTILLYVGIGCGAGWVTTYAGQPAILFGLENAAEEGWTKTSTLNGFVAHEMGHVAHFHRRALANLADGSGPWWQLYTEGFAQWCEHLLLARPTWHMQDEARKDWLDWCQENRGWLAAEFLRRVNKGESTRPFFGSWYEIQGYKQTGYFLGHELIKTLAATYSLREIALLQDFAAPLIQLLEEMSAN